MLGISIWGTIMSPGAGVVALIIMVLFWGMSFIKAKATTIIAGIPSSIYATWFMWTHGFVDREIFIPLLIGYVVGAWLGASFALKKGNRWLKKLIIVVTIASLVKIILL